jgi:hypothetical protein
VPEFGFNECLNEELAHRLNRAQKLLDSNRFWRIIPSSIQEARV